tara:strand:+ start:124 stop:321 length:198 start_codon:yes stop_codon:yes gene_type:complete
MDVFENQSLHGRKANGKLLSHSMFANNGASKHLHLTRTTGEVTRPAVDGHHGDRSTGLQNVEVMA